jgi:hypothetical protein
MVIGEKMFLWAQDDEEGGDGTIEMYGGSCSRKKYGDGYAMAL